MRKKLCSIIVPAYNCEKFVGKTLESICSQTYKDLEIIIINDCSVDQTAQVIKNYALMDKRIRSYNNEKNIGVSATRNYGVSLARGKWIAFLDSDDYWLPDKLEKQFALIERTKADLCYTGCNFINHTGKELNSTFKVAEKITYKQLLYQNIIVCSSVLVKKKLLLKHPMCGDEMHEDFAVWLKILKEGNSAYGVNEPLVMYRISKGSKSGNKIKAAKMTYKVYKHLGIMDLFAYYYIIWYLLKNLKKYSRIYYNLAMKIAEEL